MAQFQSSVLLKFVTVFFVMVGAVVIAPSAASAQASLMRLQKILSPGSSFQKTMTEDHPLEAAVCDCSLNSTSGYIQPTESLSMLSATGKYLSDTYHSVSDWSVTKAKSAAKAVVAAGKAVIPGCEFLRAGIASFYANKFEGRRTASGERFSLKGSTVAHKKLPLGTKITLRDPATGKTAEAKVNDRGPYTKGREVDLTPSLFRKFASTDRGHMPLEIYVCN